GGLIHAQARVNSESHIISWYLGGGRARGNGGTRLPRNENPTVSGGRPVLRARSAPAAGDGVGTPRQRAAIRERDAQGADCAARARAVARGRAPVAASAATLLRSGAAGDRRCQSAGRGGGAAAAVGRAGNVDRGELRSLPLSRL